MNPDQIGMELFFHKPVEDLLNESFNLSRPVVLDRLAQLNPQSPSNYG